MNVFIKDELQKNNISSVIIGGLSDFSVHKIFDCGQAFRFDPDGNENRFTGIAFGKKVTFESLDESTLLIENSTPDEFRNVWFNYLSLDVNYAYINEEILAAMPNERDRTEMSAMIDSGRGIRILRQDPFEALISFIISQNNNIPRIKGIISAMCKKYGENGSFPTVQAILDAGEDGIFKLKTGFRAGYIIDAARKVESGEVDFDFIKNCDDYEKCTEMLCRIKGVGPKVSSCVLLFGFNKTEAFPIDVWMKRSLALHFPDGFDPKRLGKYAGIAQQYMFYHERWTQEGSSKV